MFFPKRSLSSSNVVLTLIHTHISLSLFPPPPSFSLSPFSLTQTWYPRSCARYRDASVRFTITLHYNRLLIIDLPCRRAPERKWILLACIPGMGDARCNGLRKRSTDQLCELKVSRVHIPRRKLHPNENRFSRHRGKLTTVKLHRTNNLDWICKFRLRRNNFDLSRVVGFNNRIVGIEDVSEFPALQQFISLNRKSREYF